MTESERGEDGAGLGRMEVGAFGDEPFTIAQAAAAGITARQLRSTDFARVLQGVYVAAGVAMTLRLRARAALLLQPTGVLSHHTAAVLLGATAPETGDVHLTVLRDRHAVRTRVAGLVVHEAQQHRYLHHDGLPVTTAESTFLDLAAHLDLTELVVTGDALVRRAGAAPDQFVQLAAETTCRGVRLARAAAELVRQRVDSPMESRLRMLVVLSGLPEPIPGVDVYFESGGWLARPDLQYPEQRIAIEYDGRHHLDDPVQWRRDIGRRENLEREGWRVRVVTARDLYSTPLTLLGRIRDDLADRGHPELPPRLDLDHLPHFAARALHRAA
jgi:hypothetical protein